MSLGFIKEELKELSNPERARSLKKYFYPKNHESAKEEFLGITVPELRKLSKKFSGLLKEDLEVLLKSNIHEERQLALFILIIQYKNAKKEAEKKVFVDLYLENLDYVNNWDLVDDSSHKILGDWLLDKNKSILFELANSSNPWKRRIAIVSTLAFIRKNRFHETIQLADTLLNDEEKLVQKAVGWMIREVYKREPRLAKKWISQHLLVMPGIMLRYATEKIPERERFKLLYANR